MDQNIQIRPYQTEDANLLLRWLQNKRSFYYWSANQFDHYPIHAEDIRNLYEKIDAQLPFYPMMAVLQEETIGHFTIRVTDEEKKQIRLGFILINPTKRGQGLGKRMLTAALHYALDTLEAEKISIGVVEHNEAAYRCYTALGFQESQTVPPSFLSIEGESWKYLELEMTRSDFIDSL